MANNNLAFDLDVLSTEFLRFLQQGSHECFFVLTTENQLAMMSNNCADITSWQTFELLGQQEVSDYEQPFLQEFRSALERPHRQTGPAWECQLPTRTGEHQWFEIACHALGKRSGPGAAIGVLRNIHIRKQRQVEIALRCTLMQQILDGISHAIYIVDADYRVLFANQAACQQHGVDSGKPITGICHEFFHQSSHPCAYCQVPHALHTRQLSSESYYQNTPDGQTRYYNLSAHPIINHLNQVQATIVMIEERTREKALENQLYHSAKLAMLGEVATGIAHEVRNPLASIKLALHTLARDCADNLDVTPTIDCIRADIDRINHVVTQVLEFSRDKPFHREQVRLSNLFESVLLYIGHLAETKNITVNCQYPSEVHLWCDRERVKQILLNISLNAIQAMPNGGQLTLSAVVDANTHLPCCVKICQTLRIVCQDTGTGIPEQHQPKIFDPFFSSHPKGTGLGLPTTYHYTRQHQGELKIQSRTGEGTKVEVILPLDESCDAVS